MLIGYFSKETLREFNIKISGTKHDDGVETTSPILLSELVFQASPASLQALASFFGYAAAEMQRMGETYDHIHWQDVFENWSDSLPDIIILRE